MRRHLITKHSVSSIQRHFNIHCILGSCTKRARNEFHSSSRDRGIRKQRLRNRIFLPCREVLPGLLVDLSLFGVRESRTADAPCLLNYEYGHQDQKRGTNLADRNTDVEALITLSPVGEQTLPSQKLAHAHIHAAFAGVKDLEL